MSNALTALLFELDTFVSHDGLTFFTVDSINGCETVCLADCIEVFV